LYTTHGHYPAYTRAEESQDRNKGFMAPPLTDGRECGREHFFFTAVNYAVAITWKGSATTVLLLVAINTFDQRRMGVQRHMSTLSSNVGKRFCSWNSGYVQKEFEGAPVLNVTEVELFFNSVDPKTTDAAGM
jgi:hypothetical protein